MRPIADPPSGPTFALQPLEPRRLLSAVLVDGVVRVNGSSGPDSIVLTAHYTDQPGEEYEAWPTLLDVYVNGQHWQFPQDHLRGVRVYGAEGNDRIRVQDFQTPGTDEVAVVFAPLYLHGGAGDDGIWSLSGSDTLIGGPGNDRLDAGDGRDYLGAGLGNDTLIGGTGIDTLDGGDGNDLLVGDRLPGSVYLPYSDVLIGGTGRDAFDSADAPAERKDFNPRRDYLRIFG